MRWFVAVSVIALLMSYGCKNSKRSAKTPASAAAGTNAASLPGSPARAQGSNTVTAAKSISFPANAIALAGLASFDTLYTIVEKKSREFGSPLPMTKGIVLTQIQSALGMTSMNWFATDKPIRILLWNPKQSPNPSAILVALKSKDALVKALPATKKDNVDGNQYMLDIFGQTVYLNIVGSNLAITGDKAVFGNAKSYIESHVNDWSPRGLFDIHVSLSNLKTIFNAEMTTGMAQIDTIKNQLRNDMNSGAFPIPGLDKVLDLYVSIAKKMVDEAQNVSFSLDYKNGNATLATGLEVKAGGQMAAFASMLAKARMDHMSGIPANSWAAFGGDIDPKLFAGMKNYAIDMMGSILKLSDAEKTEFGKLYQELLKVQDGRSWVALYADGKFPLAIKSMAGTSDGAAYMAAMDKYMQIVFTKGITMARDKMPAPLKHLPADNFSIFVDGINGLAKPFGVTLSTRADGNIRAFTIQVDPDLVAKVAGPEAGAKVNTFTSILGTKFEFALVYGDKVIGIGMGPNGIKAAQDVANGKAGGGNALTRILTKSGGFGMSADLGAALKAFGPILQAAGKSNEVPKFENGTTISFGLTGKGNSINAYSEVAVDKILKAIKKNK